MTAPTPGKPLVRASDHRPCITREENALFCYLRLHPDVSNTYGIKSCTGKTTIGSMLVQTLHAQGLNIDWYSSQQQPQTAAAKGTNAAGASWVKQVSRRPGARSKQLSERPQVAPTDKAAILRKNGRLSQLSFPMLLKLSACKRGKKFTACGNHVRPPQAVALVERHRLTAYVERQFRCACGAHLRFCKAASHQVGGCRRACCVAACAAACAAA